VACREPWGRAMQSGAGWDAAVVIAVGILQVLGWGLGRKVVQVRWVESVWGRLFSWLFSGGRDGGRRDEGGPGRPLLAGPRDGGADGEAEEGRDDGDNGDEESRGGGNGFGYGGFAGARG